MLCSITPFKGNKIPKMFAKNIATLIKGTDLANKIKLQVRNELINIRKAKPEFEPQFVAIAIGKRVGIHLYEKFTYLTKRGGFGFNTYFGLFSFLLKWCFSHSRL